MACLLVTPNNKNVQKCYAEIVVRHLWICIAGLLHRVENFVDLGITIDNKLKFSSFVSKAHKRTNLIIRCFMSRDLSSLVRAFTVCVRPILEYCM